MKATDIPPGRFTRGDPLKSMPTSRADIHALAARVAGTPPLALEANIRIVQAYAALSSTMDAYLLQFGLSSSRFAVMRLLFQAPEQRPTMGQLRHQLGVTSTNVSRLVDALERKGFVLRSASRNDRRVVHAQLTEDGEAVFLKALPGVLHRITAFWQDFDESTQQVVVDVMKGLWHAAGKVRV